jgi:signal transduction histidine kinase/ActR/RegA family two-component response regulator
VNSPANHELTSTARLRRRVLWFGIVLIALIVVADGYEGWQNYRVAVDSSQQTIGLLSRAFADQTARIVQELDFALADFAEWNARADGTVATPDIVREQLLTHIARLPYVHSAAVFGVDGLRRATTELSPATGVSIAGLPIFSVPQYTQPDALYIGTPRVGRFDGYRTFAVSRRLRTADGRFAGVVVVRVAFEYLARFYAAVDIRPGAEIRLLRTDGVDLAHYPSVVAVSSSALAETESSPPGSDGKRIISRQAVSHYPLVVEVDQRWAQALAPWWRQELANAARTMALAVLAGLLLAALATAVRRREEAEAARRAFESRLQEARKAEAISLLAASVAHDFNNVLGAIVGYGELARAEALPDSPMHSKLGRLLAAAERARLLVRRVLTFDTSRTVRYETVVFGPVVLEVIDQLQATLPAAIKLEYTLPDLPVATHGDATEIHQVIMNLCTNAVQSMPNGGTLTILLSPTFVTAGRSFAVGQVEPGEWVCLSVVDQGVGIGAEALERIFDPLHTGNAAGQGTGIGLTVVRNIIANTHGAIDVESVANAGSRFTVYWRRKRVDACAPGPEERAAIRRPGGGQTILIVDDEPQLVALVEELTASLGYEPVGFSDPQRALNSLRQDPGRFDAVITDERMPGLRGTAFAKAVSDLRPDLPVILVTGYRVAELDLEARRCGIRHILDKPLTLDELARVLSDVFGANQGSSGKSTVGI